MTSKQRRAIAWLEANSKAPVTLPIAPWDVKVPAREIVSNCR